MRIPTKTQNARVNKIKSVFSISIFGAGANTMERPKDRRAADGWLGRAEGGCSSMLLLREERAEGGRVEGAWLGRWGRRGHALEPVVAQEDRLEPDQLREATEHPDLIVGEVNCVELIL